MEASNRAADKVGSGRHDNKSRDSSDSLCPNYQRQIPSAKYSSVIPTGEAGRQHSFVAFLALGLLLISAVFVLFIPSAPDAYTQSSGHTSTLTISSITQSNPTPSQANVIYQVVAQRDGVNLTVNCSPGSGSAFQVATNPNTVQCTFSDGVVLSFKIYIDTTAPTSSANPPQGTYNTAQSVTLSSNEPGTIIYYTTDGSPPSTSSAQYSSPIQISNTTTLKFFGRDVYLNPVNPASSIITQQYTIDTTAPTVIASPVGGLYNTTQSVTLTPSENATIYYTTDGTPPTVSSSSYSSPIAISSGTTILNYFAMDGAGNSGIMGSQTYTVDTMAPTVIASPVGAVYNAVQSVSLNASETASIYYTTDGSTPTIASSQYNGSSIPVIHNTILKFIAHDTAGNIGAVLTETYTITGTTIASTTGAGMVGFSTSAGSFASIEAISEAALPTSGKPTGMTFDYGFFLWNVTDLTQGQEITVTITYPAAIPANTQYWTVIGGSWINLTHLLSSNNGDNELVLTLTDGLQGDEDGSSNGQISDPGGSATIVDTTPPSITAPVDITQEASGSLTTLETLGTPTVSDSVDPSPAFTNDAPVDGFPLGNTTVTWTATDDAGNTAVANQTVTITDTTAPSITAPADVSTEATGPLTLTVTLGTPLVSDIADSSLNVTNDAPPGGFPVGNTTVTWTATDDAGNTAVANQTVTITDTTAPSITAPTDITQEATGQLTSVDDLGLPIVSDIADQSPTVTNDAPVDGFPVGNTTVTWTAADDSGNLATAAQTITITDTSTPSITAPEDIILEATSEFTLVPLGSPVVTDEEDPSPTVTNDAPPGGFPVGNTTVTWTAADDSGNSANAVQLVTLTDTTPPTVLALPAGNTYGTGQEVELSSSDSVSGNAAIYYTTNGDPPTTSSAAYSGTKIEITVDTTLKFFGVDAAGNSGTVVTESYTIIGTQIQSATGTGQIIMSTSEGSFQTVNAVSESSLPIAGKPSGLIFEHGFVSYLVTGVTPGDSVTLTFTYPSAIPTISQYWTVVGGTWVDLTSQLGSNDGDNTITLTITDGDIGDEDGMVNGEISDPSGSGYVPDSIPPVINASPTGGVYSASQSVMLSSNEANTDIYYTMNGVSPTTSSTPYTGVPVSISTDTTLKFFGVDASGNASPITTQLYDINPAPAIVMLDKTNGTGWGIYATRPVLAEYVSPSSVLVGKQIDSITLDLKKTGPSPPGTAQIGIINPDLSMKKVFATITAATIGTAYTYYEYNLPPGDSYTIQAGDRIGIKYTAGTTSTAYLSVVRDVTPSDPFDGTSSHLTSYTTSWAMSGDTLNYDLTMVLKYSAGSSGSGSDTTPPTVTASPAAGSFNTAKLVILTTNEPATIHYTLDGSTPTLSSPVYSGSPISISTTTTLKFFAQDVAGNSGTVQTQVYVIDTAAPTVTASPVGGSYNSAQSVVLTGSESGTTIYYTTNGVDPEPSSLVYASPLQLTSNTILKFYGKDTAGNFGSITTEAYTITLPDTAPPTVTASPLGGSFGPAGTSVTLTGNEPASIYYTTNGDIPNETSSSYSSSIPISSTTTLKYFGKDTTGNTGAIQTQVYTIDNVSPTVTASPPGGTYTSSQSVILSSSESGTSIRYTTDGIDPTGFSSLYSGPIGISTDTTLKFFGTDSFGNVGSIVTELYDINAPSQPPGIVMQTISTSGQSVWSGRQVHAEFVGPSSALVGKHIDSITLVLKKVEAYPPGTAQVGIINSDLSMKKVFATITASTLPLGYTSMEYALPSGDYYTIVAGDRIGIKYASGTSATYIAVQRDTTGGYDGANTYHTTYTGVWNAYTTIDLTMTLKFSGSGVSNTSPVSNAGPDQSVNEGTLVTLTGLGSTDSDGTVASYAWSQTSGPAVSLSSTTASQPTFTAPSVGSSGTLLTFSLVVTDNQGLADPTPDTVQVTVNDVALPNNPPVANAGLDQTVNENVLVTLTGLGSTDSDGTVASYAWSQTSGPAVSLSSTTASQPTFTAPLVSATTTLTFSLVVTDNNGAADSTPDSMTVTVNDVPPGGQPPGIVMLDTTADSGRSIMSTRPVYAEYVGTSSVLEGKQIDSITVSLKKFDASTTGTAYVGIINSDLSMKKVFATLDISTLSSTSYTPNEFILPSGDNYTIQAGDRIGVKYTGLEGNHVSIQRDLTASDPFDGTNTHLTYYEGSSWVTTGQTSYDLTMTLKLID